jgi:beta/gamma crystallin
MARIVLFKDTCLKGDTREFTGPVSNLRDFGFNDVVSSLVVTEGTWELFQNADFKGNRYLVNMQGGAAQTNAYPTSKSWGGPNDNLSSLRPVS